MSMLVTAKILSFLLNILRVGQFILSKLSIFGRNRGIKKKYKDAEDKVEDGKVDDINEILR